MKRLLKLALLIVLGITMVPAMAQQAKGKKTAEERKAAKDQWANKLRDDWDPAKRAERATKVMTKKLALTKEQAEKVRPLAVTRFEELRNLITTAKKDQDRKAFVEARRKNLVTFEEGLKGVLTADQLAKYEQLKAEMKAKAKERAGKASAGKPEAADDDMAVADID